jgi:hypothetical protein
MESQMKKILLLISHGVMLVAGVALGIYLLPLLVEPAPVDQQMVAEVTQSARYTAQFKRELEGSDWLHWGEGKVALSDAAISFDGELAPGPDYKLYLVPEFVETEAQFLALKSTALRVGDVKNFSRFVLPVPPDADLKAYTTVVIWCETFGQFISAAQYR